MQKLMFEGTFLNAKEWKKDPRGLPTGSPPALRKFRISSLITEHALDGFLDNAHMIKIERSHVSKEAKIIRIAENFSREPPRDTFDLVLEVLAAQGKQSSKLYQETARIVLQFSDDAMNRAMANRALRLALENYDKKLD
jgi:hypothetical protein